MTAGENIMIEQTCKYEVTYYSHTQFAYRDIRYIGNTKLIYFEDDNDTQQYDGHFDGTFDSL